jgi:hypothetical protein
MITIALLLETTPRTPRLENVSMNLHHLGLGETSARMQIVHVLCNEEKFVGMLRQFGNCFMTGIRSGVANMPAALTIPFPNQARIARERFRGRQLYRIQIAPVAIFATKGWNSAFS